MFPACIISGFSCFLFKADVVMNIGILTVFKRLISAKRRIISRFQFFCVSLFIINQNIIIKMKNGIVKFFNETKGFGFIKANDSDEEFFVHVSGLKEEIRQKDRAAGYRWEIARALSNSGSRQVEDAPGDRTDEREPLKQVHAPRPEPNTAHPISKGRQRHKESLDESHQVVGRTDPGRLETQ